MGQREGEIIPDSKNHNEFKILAAAVHDLKTPLAFIRQASLKLNQTDISKEQRSIYLGRIESSAERLINLIESITSATEIQQTQLSLEPIHVPDVIVQAINDILPYASEVGFDINVKHSTKLPLVLSHRLALRRIIYNLLDNALKYSHDQRRISIYTQRDDQQVRISVRDYGIGVKKSDIDQIFKLFGKASQPSSSMVGSSGLGLYIASCLSQSMSAKLSVCPHADGTSFLLRIPVANQLKLF